IPRHRDPHLTMLGQQRLRCRPITRIPAATTPRIATLIPKMLRELSPRRGLHQPADQLLEQPTRTRQILRRLIPSKQLIEQLLADLSHDAFPSETGSACPGLAPHTQTIGHPPLQLAATQLQAERGELGPDTTREQLLADALVALASSFLATGLAERAASDEYRIVVFPDGPR